MPTHEQASVTKRPVGLMLVDSHAHIDAPAFDIDRANVLERARGAGVGDIIVPATTAARWPALARICADHDGLHAAYGLHPMFLHDYRVEHLDDLPRWLDERHAVAVGECGLDYSDAAPPRALQLPCFARQLAIARELGLPVIVHARRAVEDVIVAVRDYPGVRGIVHSFAGSREQARRLAGLGFLVGIGGPVTHARAHRLRATVADIAIDTLLLETDSPDQPGARHRGARNEPAWLVEVVDCIADLRGVAPAAIAAATTANARRLFALA